MIDEAQQLDNVQYCNKQSAPFRTGFSVPFGIMDIGEVSETL
jgi:hypothetical protein